MTIIGARGGLTTRQASPWFTIEGALLIVLGVAALILPVSAGLAAALVLGWVLLLGGVLGLVSAFAGGGHAHRVWSIVAALVALLLGLLLITDPAAGAVTLATIVAAYLIVDGAALLFSAAHHQAGQGARWAWLAVIGLVDVIVGVAVLFMGPLASAVLVGFIVGVDLIVGGLALIGVGRAMRA